MGITHQDKERGITIPAQQRHLDQVLTPLESLVLQVLALRTPASKDQQEEWATMAALP